MALSSWKVFLAIFIHFGYALALDWPEFTKHGFVNTVEHLCRPLSYVTEKYLFRFGLSMVLFLPVLFIVVITVATILKCRGDKTELNTQTIAIGSPEAQRIRKLLSQEQLDVWHLKDTYDEDMYGDIYGLSESEESSTNDEEPLELTCPSGSPRAVLTVQQGLDNLAFESMEETGSESQSRVSLTHVRFVDQHKHLGVELTNQENTKDNAISIIRSHSPSINSVRVRTDHRSAKRRVSVDLTELRHVNHKRSPQSSLYSL